MSALDFQRIAIALAMAKPKPDWSRYYLQQWRIDVNAVADSLAFDYPGFNRADFLAECDYYE